AEWCGNCEEARLAHERHQELGLVGKNIDRLVCDVTIRHADENGKNSNGRVNRRHQPSAHVVWTGSIELPVRFVESIDQAQRPVAREDVGAAVRRALKLTLQAEGPKRRGKLDMRTGISSDAVVDRLAVGLRVELLRDQSVRDAITVSVLESP